ncbi:General transcription factor IIF subunit 2 [Toxocara canis]|uniref:General transcription factor IIF subunit 2 n=1 Tax=Toxocara canis TaxID=6265 RepID=A0A0B2UY05_TOXCA|nr:General transcription factor IIF subunit 2 [Toxocara canis]
MSAKKRFSDRVDCEMARRGVWLVKVPRYLSEVWEKHAGRNVGTLVIKSASGKTDIIFKSSSGLCTTAESETNSAEGSPSTSQPSTSGLSHSRSSSALPLGKKKPAVSEIPSEYTFLISDVKNQSLSILSEDKSGLNEDAEVCSGRLSLEGRVVKRADCRPPQTAGYLKMKINHIEKSSIPKRQLKQIDKAEVKFKPIAIHAETCELLCSNSFRPYRRHSLPPSLPPVFHVFPSRTTHRYQFASVEYVRI